MTHEELLLFGERLRNRRLALHFTQETVADQVGISLRYYQMIERGENAVSMDTLIGISRALRVSVDYLLFGDLSNSLENPGVRSLVEIMEQLTPAQRADAMQLLKLYAKACKRE